MSTVPLATPTAAKYKFGPWIIECLPRLGGRISRLSYGGFDFLTPESDAFRPPTSVLVNTPRMVSVVVRLECIRF